MAQQPPEGPQPLHYRGFTNTLRHTTPVRTPLDECSATTWRPSATFRFVFLTNNYPLKACNILS